MTQGDIMAKKEFKPLEKWFTKCPQCFKGLKGSPLAQLPVKPCPNPNCTISSYTQFINQKLKGCNYCMPDKIGDKGEALL